MKRDLSSEHPINIFLRALRAASGRARAFWMNSTGFFGEMGSGSFFGRGARFINPGLMKLDSGVCFGIDARVECFGATSGGGGYRLTIGAGTTFGDRVHLGCANRIEIGENNLFGSNILIIDHMHGTPREDVKPDIIIPPSERPIVSKGRVVIEDNVWVGDGVIILPNVRIGEGAIIGAGAIVRADIAAKTIYVGR